MAKHLIRETTSALHQTESSESPPPSSPAIPVTRDMRCLSPLAVGGPLAGPHMPELLRQELSEWPRLRQAAARRRFEAERVRRMHPVLRWFRGFLRLNNAP